MAEAPQEFGDSRQSASELEAEAEQYAASLSEEERMELVSETKVIHSDRDVRSYISPRMQRELVARGHQINENTVARLMRDHRAQSVSSRKFRVTT